jgi:hypothetical protein
MSAGMPLGHAQVRERVAAKLAAHRRKNPPSPRRSCRGEVSALVGAVVDAHPLHGQLELHGNYGVGRFVLGDGLSSLPRSHLSSRDRTGNSLLQFVQDHRLSARR